MDEMRSEGLKLLEAAREGGRKYPQFLFLSPAGMAALREARIKREKRNTLIFRITFSVTAATTILCGALGLGFIIGGAWEGLGFIICAGFGFLALRVIVEGPETDGPTGRRNEDG